MNLDKNGIPILDPPSQANKLPPECHPALHDFQPLDNRVARDGYSRVLVKVCRRCKTMVQESRT